MAGYGVDNSGSLRLTADGVVGTSGKPIRLFSATWLSDGTARDLILYNGTSTSGQLYVQNAGTISKTVTLNWQDGLLFPSGCYWDMQATTGHGVFSFRQEQ